MTSGGRGCLRTAARRAPLVSLLLSALAVFVHLAPFASEGLQYDRPAIAAGELLRLVTCHWTHWSAQHLVWDVLMFAALSAVCEYWYPRRWWTCLAVSVLAIPGVVWWLLPAMPTYRGLSGLDSALFGLLCAMLIRQSFYDRQWPAAILAILLIAFIVAKITYETATGCALFVHSDDGMVPVPLAHLVGLLVGLAAALPAPSVWFSPRTLPG